MHPGGYCEMYVLRVTGSIINDSEPVCAWQPGGYVDSSLYIE
jgi:hypothetical protein